MVEARYYTKQENGDVKCGLCPHNCTISNGKTGICKVRANIEGVLYSNNYEKFTAVNVDPVEKKPLYHFYPGKFILSVGSNGCNLKCKCCQNWEIAHTSVKNYMDFKKIDTGDLLEIAKHREGNIGIAYTYNEPVVWFEYVIDIAKKVHEAGLKNVLVSNGYINEGPLEELNQYIDAYNIDLKAFNEEGYKEFTSSSLDPVLKTIKTIVKSGKHIELTNLIVPTINENVKDFSGMIDWITEELGKETILHLSRYYPAYKMRVEATPPAMIKQLFEIAKKKLKYVYVGNINIEIGQDTFCCKCNNVVITRKGYSTKIIAIDNNGNCTYCRNKVVGQM